MPRHQRGTNRYRFIHLVRHGEYEESPDHFGGLLTERGIEQAHCVAERLREVPVDAIYSSKMHRAYQTAQIIVEDSFPGFEVRQTPWLNERIFPGYHVGDEIDEDAEDVAREMLWKLEDRFFRPSRSERHDVIVCHGNVIRALVTRVLEAPVECWVQAAIANCGITQIVNVAPRENRLISFNERGHLPYRLRRIGCGE